MFKKLGILIVVFFVIIGIFIAADSKFNNLKINNETEEIEDNSNFTNETIVINNDSEISNESNNTFKISSEFERWTDTVFLNKKDEHYKLYTLKYEDAKDTYLVNNSNYTLFNGDSNTFKFINNELGDSGVFEVINVNNTKYIILVYVDKGKQEAWKQSYDYIMEFNELNNVNAIKEEI